MKSFLAALLLVAGTAATAAADPILEPYAPYKLVGMMPDTTQALLWDEKASEYRLAKLGDELDGWRLAGVDPKGRRVSLQKEDLIDELELVRLPRPGSVIIFKQDVASAPAPGEITPTVIGNGKAPVVAAPVAPPAPPAPPPPPPLIEQTSTLSRADVDREINDFDKLMSTVKVAQADGGGFTIIKLDPKSWIASLGFKSGDVVRSVAGETISTVEDAARVYARLRAVDSFAAEVERGPQKVILKFHVK